ncbi:MAG: beta-N-acetylhexosaminidase [Eubacteriales bacterium]|nr:beta-N-acetylhexosaminidase [Eubacteriales bacterium]
MDERIQVGQHLFTGFLGPGIPAEFARTVREHKIGNVVLFARNVRSAPQLKALCADIQALVQEATGYPAFIAIDQEGGAVSRLSEDCTAVPGAMALAATGKPENSRVAGQITGRELQALGVNFNLAPVLDINSNPDNPVIGVRSFGDTPQEVTTFGVEMARGLMESGILCCAKHFPGHGDTAVDSHVGLPMVNKPLEELLAFELIPFQAAIEAGIPGVMSTHILFPQLDAEKVPATMSPVIMTDLLRGRMGFDGLILSDCMMMGAIADHYGTVKGMAQAVQAGVDLVFASHSAELAAQGAQQIRQDLRSGFLNANQFRASTERILRYKQAIRPPAPETFAIVGGPKHRRLSQSLHEQALTAVRLPTGGLPRVGKNPMFIGCLPFEVSQADTPHAATVSFADQLHASFGGTAHVMSGNPDQEETTRIASKAKGHSCLIIGTYYAHQRPGQQAVVHTLRQTGIPLITIALGSPYDLSGLPYSVSAIAAYAYNPPTLRALRRLLAGEISANGRLPVALKEAEENV